MAVFFAVGLLAAVLVLAFGGTVAGLPACFRTGTFLFGRVRFALAGTGRTILLTFALGREVFLVARGFFRAYVFNARFRSQFAL